jgi:hypothetical protein
MAILRGARLDTTCKDRAVQERVGEGRGWIAGGIRRCQIVTKGNVKSKSDNKRQWK